MPLVFLKSLFFSLLLAAVISGPAPANAEPGVSSRGSKKKRKKKAKKARAG